MCAATGDDLRVNDDSTMKASKPSKYCAGKR